MRTEATVIDSRFDFDYWRPLPDTRLLWGGGDLAYMVIETNHDVRASRVLLWQLNMLRQMEMGQKGMIVEPVTLPPEGEPQER